MWSVRTMPCLVLTVEPSTIGNRSRCTPWRDTSGPIVPSRPAILSISSRKTIPDCSTRRTASFATTSMSTSRFASSAVRWSSASGTFTCFFFVFFGSRLEKSSFMLNSISSIPWGVSTSTIGEIVFVTSSSTSRSSRRPSRSMRRSLSRAELALSAPATCAGVDGFGGDGGKSKSRRRSSATSRARRSTLSFSSALTRPMPSSTRSRMIDSTSRPT